MNFKKWVKSIQTSGYNGARTVFAFYPKYFRRLIKRTAIKINDKYDQYEGMLFHIQSCVIILKVFGLTASA
jgi:hypothetical protein